MDNYNLLPFYKLFLKVNFLTKSAHKIVFKGKMLITKILQCVQIYQYIFIVTSCDH